MKWYLEAWTKYAVFSGRARRREYWTFTLFNAIITWLVQFGIPHKSYSYRSQLVIPVILVILWLFGLASLLPGLAVCVRRLHDTGRSGWWLLIVIVPAIGAIVLNIIGAIVLNTSYTTSFVTGRIVGLLSGILVMILLTFGIIVLLLFTVQDSDSGENRYGPNPKEISTK